MRYTLTLLEKQSEQLNSHFFDGSSERLERAAYLLCGISQTEHETRLIVREVLPVPDEALLEQSTTQLSIPAESFLPILKRADREHACFVLVHSHPPDVPGHSGQDDTEERKLFRAAYNRIEDSHLVHASIVASNPNQFRGRVWLDGGRIEPIEMIRVLGGRFRFFPRNGFDRNIDTSFHDREIRAFGSDILPLLKGLTVGVVGAGGTGSPVIEQLIRLGVGQLIVADGQVLDRSNVSRVYGSQVDLVGRPKPTLMYRLAKNIGLGTSVEMVDKPITFASALKRFRDCDVIFGCTDDFWGRSLLTRFAIDYCIPVIDLGVKIDSIDGVIRAVPGRVTILMPGNPCLYCRGQITAQDVSEQIMNDLDPEEAARQRREGYLPELPGAEPAVVPFTTATAAFAVMEFLNRLTGFQGNDYSISEFVVRYDDMAIRKPGAKADADCFCSNATLIGKGDQQRFLDQTWRPE
jgi:molybdopterin/thiamine biosynthesis adenylyltransferase